MSDRLIPDYEKFVASLTDAQATFIWAEMAQMKSKALFSVKEALYRRVIGVEDPSALRAAMYREFYKPEHPIRATSELPPVPAFPKVRTNNHDRE